VARRLKSDPQIWRLAADLGLHPSIDPIADIRSFCAKQLRAFLREFDCKTLSELLEAAAARLDTLFIEVRSDQELERVTREYVAKGEMAFATLDAQLGPDTYAITFRRRRTRPGDRTFVSVIDCRGSKAWRLYFSKWHELAHLLTLTDQARLKFCRTHADVGQRDPEEALMEVIAGFGGFFPDLVRPHAFGSITFEKVARLREELCPEASDQASLIGFVRAWPQAAVLVRAEHGLKKAEQLERAQASFAFRKGPTPALRAVQVTVNDEAARTGLAIPPNMRVPEKSVIYGVYAGPDSGEAEENLSWWTSSDGGRLADYSVHVTARQRGDYVQGLLVPSK